MGIWDGMIERLHTKNNGARVTTAQFCENAQKSFKKIMWRHPISGFSISFNDLKRWDDDIKSGVKDAEGKLVGEISDWCSDNTDGFAREWVSKGGIHHG